jgi:HPt (histidine-containing phosphotransfer) domain-containing protein
MQFKIIDVSYIEEICAESPELISEMVDIFREQVSEFVDEMKKLYEDKNYYDLGLLAHKAKSSIAIMGMHDLAEKLKELELNAKEAIKPETYSDHIRSFVDQTDEALKELDVYLSTL